MNATNQRRTASEVRLSDQTRTSILMTVAIHDALKGIALRERCALQVLFREGMNAVFAARGLPSWEEMEKSAAEADAPGDSE